ncbi:MAG TPA: UDP-phosphate alpha-4-amino-4-deoxy-L-arabinose arabinosyl transferase, partial [Leeuwenhoekiella sp.]|nr:UDP-phosphate alpha-4-amino-4-deoxy-L-arabinose arabinosyl transferase [Leeuwenhoekiella sp.]
GFILCFALGASWYFLVAYQNPKLWDYFVHKQVLSRINADAFNRSKPFWYYLPIVFGLLLPWLVGLLPSLRRKLKRPFKHPKELQVLWISVLLLLAIFSAFTTKLIMYILPAFWMLAIL